MIREAIRALAACVVTFVLCAVAYPAIVWGLAHLAFPREAEGSPLYRRDRTAIGSELIAQPFAQDRYFQPRPSAAGPNGYAADAASGSNLGPKNPALRERIALDAARQLARHTGDAGLAELLGRLDERQAELKARTEVEDESSADPGAIADLEEQVSALRREVLDVSARLGESSGRLVPVDLVMASGGGLDPHISPEAAHYQEARVAVARGLPAERVRALIDAHVDRSGAILGAPPRVNVLKLNLALDEEGAAGREAEGGPPARATEGDAGPGVPEAATLAPTGPVEPVPTEPATRAEGSPAPDVLAGLAERLDHLEGRVAAAPGHDLVAGMEALEARVSGLGSASEVERRLSERLGHLEGQLADVGEDLKSLRSAIEAAREAGPPDATARLDEQVRALRAEVDQLRTAAREAESPAREGRQERPVPNLAPAIELFRQRRFAGAASAFRALTRAHPDDARVWYYAGLTNGLATGQWRGETEELVNRGVERERAGTPTASEIDAAFADLTPESVRDWIAFYRRRATAP